MESEVRAVNGKERRVQKKTLISYLTAPGADSNGGGGNGGGSSQNGGTQSGGSQSGGNSQSTTLASPTISGTTPFAETTSVSISGPDGAEIHYTTDGSSPTAESTLYSEAFTLSDTTTVKAIAIKDGESSEVASKLFTKGMVAPCAIAAPERCKAPEDSYIPRFLRQEIPRRKGD